MFIYDTLLNKLDSRLGGNPMIPIMVGLRRSYNIVANASIGYN